MRKTILYISVALIIFTLASQGTTVSKRVSARDYKEECQNEGCSTEEVKELWRSYAEECLHEGCSREEVIELGGTPSGAIAMKNHFIKLGLKINERDFQFLNCSPIGTETKCWAIILMCKDSWQCPDGVHKSSWYVCGGCFFG